MTLISGKNGPCLLAMLVMLGLSVSRVDAAPIAFDYVGNDFTIHSPSSFARQRLTGSLVVEDSLLGGSLASKVLTSPSASIVAWSLFDGFQTFNQSNTGGGTFLGFAFNASGDLVDWYITTGSGPYTMTSFSHAASAPPAQWGVLYTNLVNGTSGNSPGDYTQDNSGFIARNTSPGTWTRVTPLPPTSVPEPTTLLLLGTGLLGAGVYRRRRKS